MAYGPKPKPNREGTDYYCGVCAGHKVKACEYCVEGRTHGGYRCADCKGVGETECPACCGGHVPTPRPQWLPQTPQPPRCHHAETGENPVPGGLGE